VIGTIVRQDQTTVELEVADQKDPIVVPRDAITKMEMSIGRRSRGRGAFDVAELLAIASVVQSGFVMLRVTEDLLAS
jgi:hypothetical protein